MTCDWLNGNEAGPTVTPKCAGRAPSAELHLMCRALARALSPKSTAAILIRSPFSSMPIQSLPACMMRVGKIRLWLGGT
eukprot:CAMPEP_0115562256 /NCGR_PEP_ID=MMETSP0271-20121206/101412_1 /TAXON_ID=71861 /ORGANISM="Scrippsiella trochoidea, Strain CCMP3099" /LENGTH=78 /DNA_ID=CAMNT_0002996401 /DNA_START=66 /DNA_END=298 /DNA_ORIENTATION=-